MKKIFLLCYSLFILFQIQAQVSPTIWYFGMHGGLKFLADGSTVQIYDGKTWNFEGCTIVNDADGNVVFYADGLNLWDGAHTLITSSLLGGNSATQAALAVQIPGVEVSGDTKIYKYLLFNVNGEEEGSAPNFSVCFIRVTATGSPVVYSVSADAPGYIVQNVKMSEKLASTPDGSGGSWVFTHEYRTSGTANNFYGYHVDQSFSGISTTNDAIALLNSNQLIQPTGANHSGIGECAQGQMKFNTQGTRLAVAIAGSKKWEIFDFNKTTGALSTSPVFEYLVNGQGFLYGCEFSPLGNKFYASEGQKTGTYVTRHIYQWDISGSTLGTTVVVATHHDIGDYYDYMYDAMQLGPNGKIYCTYTEKQPKLSVINSPDLDAFDYDENSVNIGNKAEIGLPSYSILGNFSTPPSSQGCTCTQPTIAGEITHIDKVNGTAQVTLSLNPGDIAPAYISLEFANFEVYTENDDCKKLCDMKTENMGMIVNPTPSIYLVQGELTSLVPNTGMTYSREITWDMSHNPIWAAHTEITLNLKFPPISALSCCTPAYYAVFRIIYADANCNSCQYLIRTNGVSDKAVKTTGNGVTPAIKVTAIPAEDHQKNVEKSTDKGISGLTVYPNPNEGTFTISTQGLGYNASYTVLDEKGTRVVSGVMKSWKEVVSVPLMTPGLYVVKVTDGKQEFVQKVIVRNNK